MLSYDLCFRAESLPCDGNGDHIIFPMCLISVVPSLLYFSSEEHSCLSPYVQWSERTFVSENLKLSSLFHVSSKPYN